MYIYTCDYVYIFIHSYSYSYINVCVYVYIYIRQSPLQQGFIVTTFAGGKNTPRFFIRPCLRARRSRSYDLCVGGNRQPIKIELSWVLLEGSSHCKWLKSALRKVSLALINGLVYPLTQPLTKWGDPPSRYVCATTYPPGN